MSGRLDNPLCKEETELKGDTLMEARGDRTPDIPTRLQYAFEKPSPSYR